MLDKILGNYDAIEREVEEDYATIMEAEQCRNNLEISQIDISDIVEDNDE